MKRLSIGFNSPGGSDIILNYSLNKDLADEFDYSDSVDLNGNLVYLINNTDTIELQNTPFKSVEDIKKALIDGYDYAKAYYDKYGMISLDGFNGPSVFQYFLGYTFEEDSNDLPDTAEEFVNKLFEYLNSTYVNGDSDSVICFIDPDSMTKVLGGDIDLYEI